MESIAESDTRQNRTSLPKRAIGAVGIGLFGTGFAVGSYGTYVTLLIDQGVAPDAAGFGMTLFLLGQFLIVLPADRLTRRYSIQHVAVIGLAFSSLGAATTGYATLSGALISRTLLGFGQGITFIAGMKYVGLTTRQEATATAQGLLGALFTLGFAIGLAATPIAIDQLGSFPPALLAAGTVALGAGATARLDGLVGSNPVPVRDYLTPFVSPVGLVLGLANMATFGFLMVAATWYTDVLSSTSTIPVTTALVGFALATVVGRGVGGWLSTSVGERATVQWSMAGLALLLLLIAWSIQVGSGLLLAGALVATGLGFGIPFGPLFSLAFSELADDPGVTLVGMLVVGNLGALVFPWLVGRLLADTNSYAYGFAILGLTVVGVWMLWRSAIGTRIQPATETSPGHDLSD